MGDGMIEVVGIESAMYVGQVKAGLRTSGRRLSQCKEVVIRWGFSWFILRMIIKLFLGVKLKNYIIAIFRTKKRFPMQIDGEPWMQPACEIRINIKNQVPVLVAPHSTKSKSRSPVSWSFFGSHKKRRGSLPNMEESLVLP